METNEQHPTQKAQFGTILQHVHQKNIYLVVGRKSHKEAGIHNNARGRYGWRFVLDLVPLHNVRAKPTRVNMFDYCGTYQVVDPCVHCAYYLDISGETPEDDQHCRLFARKVWPCGQWEQSITPGKYEIDKSLCLNTAHITAEDNNLLVSARLMSMVYEGGHIVYVSAEEEDVVREHAVGLSEHFWNCYQLARSLECKWLQLDADGPVEPILQTHEW